MSDIHIQRLVPAKGIPSASSLRAWAQTARGKKRAEITLRNATGTWQIMNQPF